MRKLILQIRHTIFSRSLCVRHLQTIFPYSPYLHGIFTIYSNFTPHTRIYFCKAENFLLNWNLLLQFTPLLKKGTVFEHLKKEENFLRVYIDDRNAVSWDIDPEIDGSKIWSNKIDICSDSCYMDSVPLNTK